MNYYNKVQLDCNLRHLIRQIFTKTQNLMFEQSEVAACARSKRFAFLTNVTFVQIVRFLVHSRVDLTSRHIRDIIGSVSWRGDASGKSQPNTMRLQLTGATYATHMRLQPAGNT